MNKAFFVVLMLFCLGPYLSLAQRKDLKDFLRQGKQNSPLLHNYSNQIKSIGWDSAKVKAEYGFQVAASSDIMYAPVRNGWGYDQVITNGQHVNALLIVNKKLIGKNSLQLRLNSFTLQKKVIEGQSQLSERLLELQIVEQYIRCYYDQLRVSLHNEVLSLLETENEVLIKLTQASTLKQTDYLTFQVALQQQGLDQAQAKTQLLDDFAILNYICGIQDTSSAQLTAPQLAPDTASNYYQSTYADNFHIDSLKNVNDASLIRLRNKPQINVFGDGGYQSSLPNRAYKNVGISAGMNITLPLYDGKQRKMSLMQNQIAEDSRKKSEEYARQQFGQQKMRLMQQLNEYQGLIATAKKQMTYAQTLVRANKMQLQTGDIRMADFLLSIHQYLSLQFALIRLETMRLYMINDLNHLTLK